MTENTTASGATDLPEFPGHPEPQIMMWNALEIVAIRKYGADMFRAGRLAASAPVATLEASESLIEKLEDALVEWNGYVAASDAPRTLREHASPHIKILRAELGRLHALAAPAPVAPTQPAPMPYPTDAQIDAVYEQTMGQHLRSQDAPAVRRFGRAMFLCAWNAAAPKAAPITEAEQAAWHAGLDEGRSQARAPLHQGGYPDLPEPAFAAWFHDLSGSTEKRHGFIEVQMRAYVDADRAARGVAQAAPSPAAEDAEDAARYRWLKLQARPNEPFELFDKLREAHALVKAFDVFCTRWGGWDASIDAARAQAAQPEGGA